MKWETIETAPKDGTYVLVYHHRWNSVTKDMEIAHWRSDQGGWMTNESFNMQPSHWMPLPDQPKGE